MINPKLFRNLFCLISLALLPLNCIAWADEVIAKRTPQETDKLVKEKMMDHLDMIKNVFQVKYGPSEWKKTYSNWELDAQISLAKSKIKRIRNIGIKDFHRILLQLFNSTQDYHVGISFFSTEAAIIPIRIQGVNGRYFVAWKYQEYCDMCGINLNIGDEILQFDGQPISQVIAKLRASDFGNPESATDQALAESGLTMRMGTAGHFVPQGVASITIKRSEGSVTYSMPWLYLEEEIRTSVDHVLMDKKGFSFDDWTIYGSFRGPLAKHPFFFKDMTAPLYRNYKLGVMKRAVALNKMLKAEDDDEDDDEDDTINDHFIGSKKSFVPILGPALWEASSSCSFHAYIYLSPEGREIGYIRIPSYMGEEEDAEEFVEIMQFFENNTDALVLDQVDNPGGNIFYMYGLLSALTDRPLETPKHRMTITQADVFFALEEIEEFERIQSDEDAQEVLGETFWGIPVNYQFAQQILSYMKFVIQEWNQGRVFTHHFPVYGIDTIQPNPEGHYSKPILLLINQLDFSCGDLLPAILQDNQRATLFGTRTAGAGGYVLQHQFPNLFAVEGYSLTGSIAERKNHDPLENLGVTPDIWVDLTVKDLKQEFSGYAGKVNQAVDKMLTH